MNPLESALIGIQYFDGRVEYIVCKYDGYEVRDVLHKHYMRRAQVLELIRMGNVECKECVESIDHNILREEYIPAKVVANYSDFYDVDQYPYYYLFTTDNSWTVYNNTDESSNKPSVLFYY